MIKKYLISVLILLIMFVPNVYALTYNIETTVDNTVVSVGEIEKIKVSLENITDTVDGINYCFMNISFSNNILLNSSIETLGGWNVITGDSYMFDIDTPVSDSSDMFLIPVKINGTGTVKLTNILCTDGVEKVNLNDQVLNFVISDEGNSNDNTNNNENSNIVPGDLILDNDNCNMIGLIIEDVTIEIDPEVTEHTVKFSNFEKLNLIPVLESSGASYNLKKVNDDGNKIVIVKVTSFNGETKTYTINIDEKVDNSNESNENNKNYTIIFIGIICLLVFINIYRIVKNKIR